VQLLHDVPQKASALATQATSTAAADPKTISPPATNPQPRACLLTVETTDARVTFNGTTPDATHGLIFAKAQQPVYLPFAVPIQFSSTAGANCIVNVHWLY
jgi:hypothetical protein